MKISESSIDFVSSHHSVEKHIQREHLRTWGTPPESQDTRQTDNTIPVSADKNGPASSPDTVEFSAEALAPRRAAKAQVTSISENELPIADLNLQILRKLIERITGKVLDVKVPGHPNPQESHTGQQESREIDGRSDEQGFGMEYEYYEAHYESETTSFEGSGIIRSADGREVDFTVHLNMSREFMQEQQITIQTGEPLKDPLVVNFNGSAAELTNRKFQFDIDNDGKDDQISFVGSNSGFLALDKNGNNQVDNGSELFGPATGNGFSELAAYDSDNNNWIDENDDIFSHLRIWMADEEGEKRLFALGEKGVGAIYLNHIETPFSIKDTGNELLGEVRNSSVVVNEDGTVGTIQQIDLAV